MSRLRKYLFLLTIILAVAAPAGQLRAYATTGVTRTQNTSGNKGWVQKDGKWFFYFADGQASDVWIKPGDDSWALYVEDIYENTTNAGKEMDKLGQDWVKTTWSTGAFFMHADGGFTRNDAFTIEGDYLADLNGNQIHGWLKQEMWGDQESEPYHNAGGWMYFDPDSGKKLRTGWLADDGKRYYFNDDGVMIENGWVKWEEQWYYMGADGVMLSNTTTPTGIALAADGSSKTPAPDVFNAPDGSGYYTSGGWRLGHFPASRGAGGDHYAIYRKPDGQYYTGWMRFELKGRDTDEPYVTFWNYFADNGANLYDTKTPDGYQLDESGYWIGIK